MTQPGAVTILIDSNIFIAIAAHGADGHEWGQAASEMLSLAAQLNYRVLLSAGTRTDLLKSGELRAQREAQLAKFHALNRVPLNRPAGVTAGFPIAISGNDEVDLEVLSTFLTGAASWLISNDGTLRKRAKRVTDPDTVYSLDEALDALNRLIARPTVLPAVSTVPAYTLSLDAPIFTGLKEGYPPTGEDPGFVRWWRTKVAADHRLAIILGEPGNPEGLAVLKPEDYPDHGLTGRVLKVCTFKASDETPGSKRGELLLKAVIDHARRNDRDVLFVEMFPALESMRGWLEDFGFESVAGAATARGELVYAKHLAPGPDAPALAPLPYNIAYGPGAVMVDNAFLVPIQSKWHHRLLPEADPALDLWPMFDACGNAIRKAYLCRAPTRQLRPGDLLAFLETGTGSPATVTCVGVVEGTLVSEDPARIVGYVGARTVYTAAEIAAQCAKGEVLAIRFRLDRVLREPWAADTLRSNGVMTGTPQSITRVLEEGLPWVRNALGE